MRPFEAFCYLTVLPVSVDGSTLPGELVLEPLDLLLKPAPDDSEHQQTAAGVPTRFFFFVANQLIRRRPRRFSCNLR